MSRNETIVTAVLASKNGTHVMELEINLRRVDVRFVLGPKASRHGTRARPIRVWQVQGGCADELSSPIVAVGTYIVGRLLLHVRGPDIGARTGSRMLPPQTVICIGAELAALGPG